MVVDGDPSYITYQIVQIRICLFL